MSWDIARHVGTNVTAYDVASTVSSSSLPDSDREGISFEGRYGGLYPKRLDFRPKARFRVIEMEDDEEVGSYEGELDTRRGARSTRRISKL